MTRFPSLRATALLLAAASPLPAVAQTGVTIQALTPNADRLSEQMRILARSPNDLSALIEAGRLSGKLGDVDAAMQFLARAERVSANDPRIAAARAATLVGMERPGEALALFTVAERAGMSMTPYAAERGLAFDLLGYGANAQRDYRIALAQGGDDEVTRRLALSMGIDGDVAGATALLNPLLRQNDRAAWRVRACILAMAGDAAGADRIAATMLPGFGASLAPFFRRLPQLSAADRAFAVHFGRLAPTPERLADARLAPTVIPVPRAAPPVALAAAPAAPAATATATERPATERPASRRASSFAERRTEQRRQAEAARQAQLAETQRAAAARTAQLAQARVDETARRTALAQAQAAEAQRLRDARQLAAQQAETARLAEATRIEGVRVAARQAEERRIAAAALAARDAAAAAPPVQVAAAPVPVAVAPAPIVPAPTTPVQVAAAPPPAPGFTTVTPAASGAATSVAARSAANDEVLARIIRNLDIPAAELGIAPPVPVAATQAADAAAARAAAQAREDADRAAEARAAKLAADRKAAEAKKLADAKKAADAKKLADAEKAKAAAEAKRAADAKKADPARHWVQIAGGANVAGLPAAWAIMAGKATALKGRQAWTTPLRATNRLLTGPFKSDAEAQDFVNTLRKSGVQAFAFTSEAGQKVVRVPVK